MTAFEDKLDPQAQTILRKMPPLWSSKNSLLEIRQTLEKMIAARDEQAPPPDPNVAREDRHIPGPEDAPDVLVRIYQPVDRGNDHLSAFLWIHGGGFFLGSYTDNEKFCEQIVTQAHAVVVSVDYRLAPENPFPAAPEDCYAALQWVASAGVELQVDTTRIAVGGISAGGTLAAAVALMARDRDGPDLCFQLLLLPGVDDRCITPSYKEVTDPRVLNGDMVRRGNEAYLGSVGEDVSPYAFPARATNLSNLPPAYIHVDGLDPLRDDGIAYANRLMQSGVTTELHVFPGTFHATHAFASTIDVSQRIKAEHLSTLKRVLSS